MRVGILTREYPPEVYGGAGVHVEFLCRELRRLVDVEVHCFGSGRSEPGVFAYVPPAGLTGANPALRTIGVDLEIADAVADLDVLHSHTWYANLAGVLGATLHGLPHVLTAHSLEPQRPWKAEQLGGGYGVSSWVERQAYETASAIIAVSYGMRADVIAAYPFVDPARVHVIHNGIDTTLYAPSTASDVLDRYDIDRSRPVALFVGRITRQKGLSHLLAAAPQIDPSVQLVLCAGAPDTAEIAAETASAVAALSSRRSGVVWVRDMLPRTDPSAVGGIPEVVADGVTGLLVPCLAVEPAEFQAGLAAAVNELALNPERAAAMGLAGRERAVREFGWDTIAHRTVELYESVL